VGPERGTPAARATPAQPGPLWWALAQHTAGAGGQPLDAASRARFEGRTGRALVHVILRRRGLAPVFEGSIGIIEQKNQNGQLLVRTWRQRAGRGQQTDVARHFAAFEEIQERGGCAHGAATKFL